MRPSGATNDDMMLCLLLTLAGQQLQADAILNRQAQFQSLMTEGKATYRVRIQGFPGAGQAQIEWSRPNRQRFRLTWLNNRFEFVQNADGCLESDATAKEYYLMPPSPRYFAPQGIGTDAPALAYPTFLLNDVREILVRSAAPLLGTPETIEGRATDTVVFTVHDNVRQNVKANIDARGALARLEVLTETATSRIHQIFDRFQYYPHYKPSPDTFALRLPHGFTPVRLDETPYPSAPGEPAGALPPVVAAQNRRVDLRETYAGRVLLIVVSDPTFTTTRSLMEALDRVRGLLDSKNVAAVEVRVGALGRNAPAPTPFPVYYDPDWSFANALKVPATPYLVFLDPSGTVLGNWLGFGRDQTAELQRWIQDCASGKDEE